MSISSRTKYTLIGIVVLLTLFILIWGLNYLKGKNLFTNDNVYLTFYEQIGGLSASSPVNINGYKVGQVRNIRLNMDKKGLVEVEIAVNPKYKIPKGTKALLVSTDLMGTKAIELVLTESDEIYQPNDTLMSETEGSLKDQVSFQMLPLKHKAEDLLREMEEAIKIVRKIFNEKAQTNIQNAIEEISKSMKNVHQLTDSLNILFTTQKLNLTQTMSNIRSITDNMRAQNKNIEHIIANTQRLTDSLSVQNYSKILHALQNTMERLNKTIDIVTSGQGTAGKLITNDSLYQTLVVLVEETGNLVKDLQGNPRKYLNFSVFDFGSSKKKAGK